MFNFLYKVRFSLAKLFKPKGKRSFISSIVPKGKVLDVGCGNNSPYLTKLQRPDIYYVGLDIRDHNQSLGTNYADEYIVTNPENFHEKIASFANTFDAIISSHNLEHCNSYIDVTLAMIKALKKNGTIFIAFPCEESVNFPHRHGCLNFYDDVTHKNVIQYSSFIDLLKKNGIGILFAKKRYRPFLLRLLGFICEPVSRLLNKQIPAVTWAFYGFETIIIGKKLI
ncbi:MAG: class I SAM-dependent methyltransferase [Bacteroidetes bacterium]|nr:class I SAM-dependent methyltransferase [Bacteroidota bacterium]